MMKKGLLLMLLCCFWQISVWADHEKSIKVTQLPEMAQTFIQKHFSNRKISEVKMEVDDEETSYEVLFANGDKLEFNKAGKWKEIECKKSRVPMGLLPEKIRKYVKTHYPEVKIKEVEREKGKYEIKLANDVELTMNIKGEVIKVED